MPTCARELNRLNRRVRAVQTEQATLDAVLRQPENAEVLERSVFLNELLYARASVGRAFSPTWKRPFPTTCASQRYIRPSTRATR